MSIPKTTEGEVDFSYPAAGKPLKTWYKIVGDLSTGSRTPLICLHGGPGVEHSYLAPLADLATLFSIPVILYDQVGNGRSTHLRERDGDKEFWTDALFVAELDNLVAQLELTEYDVFGHSWGGMLGSRFAVRRPKGLRRLVIMSSPSDIHVWVAVQNELRKELPQDVQDALTRHEEAGTTDSKEYKDAEGVFYDRHLCRLHPQPEGVLNALRSIEEDPTVYMTMYVNGPSEFHVIGTIKDWTITDELHKIDVPTLLINGRYDEAQDTCVLPFFLNIPKVKWVRLENSSHMGQWEERERCCQIVGEFLTY
ncbi:proline-specific peptidase [Artomyces pyxidatus]|uniref:Proline-specific peptidase n=1 Tax=Artomyces pyxidatus TaxID=48021 RepID=A0ACB8SRF6_9AGAM|nr:proline-specific peptidase [Artomyces pyxidatus]